MSKVEPNTSDDPCKMEHDALTLLGASGWRCRGGLFTPPVPNEQVTQDQWDAIHYLCDEWDYAFEPKVSET